MNNSWPFDGEIKPVEQDHYVRKIYTNDRNGVYGNHSGAQWLESHQANSADIRRALVETYMHERTV